jgi:hypothetical protein
MVHGNDNSNLGSETDRKLAGEIAATPGHVKAQAQKDAKEGKAESGGQVAKEVAGGKKDEATDRTGRYR